jgi:carbon-monoxide dehydrogenase small subunit
VQECFKQDHALQCGFCTPGFLMTATALAASEGKRSRAEIREELAGVLCRCTGYEFVVNAVEAYLAGEPKSAADD